MSLPWGTGGATGAFADKNVGNGKTVTISGLTLGGAGRRQLCPGKPQGTTTANITAKQLTVTGVTASSKQYDGNTSATVNAEWRDSRRRDRS
jgi:hypothetical protein